MKIRQIIFEKDNCSNCYVNYDNKLSPRCVFDNEDKRELYLEHKEALIKIVEKEICDYIDNDFLCNDEEYMFPKRKYLTGEWYIRSVYFNGARLAVETALLGSSTGTADDYLGLEVIFQYNGLNNDFEVTGIDSSSI